MAQITEKIVVERQQFTVPLNGAGGAYPNAKINLNDEIFAAFGKSVDNLQVLDKSAKITVAPAEGNELVGYVTLRIFERKIPD